MVTVVYRGDARPSTNPINPINPRQAYAAAVPSERALKFADGQVAFDMEGYIRERKAAEQEPHQPKEDGKAGAGDVVAGITAGLAGAAMSLEG